VAVKQHPKPIRLLYSSNVNSSESDTPVLYCCNVGRAGRSRAWSASWPTSQSATRRAPPPVRPPPSPPRPAPACQLP
jgi:hypothetical protein